MHMLRNMIALFLAAAAAAATAESLPAEIARDRRMTVNVEINESGPHAFVVDTGAERTIIAEDLATQLKLPDSAPVQMQSVSGLSRVRTVRIDRLRLSKLLVSDIQAPALAEKNLGAAGILGIDTLHDRRIILDFRKGLLTVLPGGQAPESRDVATDEIVVRARNRFGRLVVTDADANGQKVHVIIDTGAEVTLGNSALEARLARRNRDFIAGTVDIMAVTGGIVTARKAMLKGVRLGGIRIGNLPVAISDAHIFDALGLRGKPALLLGMDALAHFDRVSIDFAQRKVRFLTPGMQPPVADSASAAAAAGPRG